MLLKRVQIKNYRCFQNVEVELDRVTVLIGENNAGKTSFLDAIRLCLSRNLARRGARLDDYDYHLAATSTQPSQAQPLEVTLDFVAEENEPTALLQAINDIIVFGTEGAAHVVLQLQSRFDAVNNDFVTELQFLDMNGNSLVGRAQRSQNLATFLQFVPIFYLNALRDAEREFRPRSAYWSPFLRDKDIPDTQRTALQAELARLNADLLTAHAPLQAAKHHLSKTQSIVTNSGNQLDVDALPIRLAQLLANAQISVSTATGAALPLDRHGSGMQSLAVIFLFEAFLATMLKEQYDPDATPILALEEPEAHLHPAAVRALWSALSTIPGQEIISTHSGELLARAPLSSIRRFCRRNGVTVAKALQSTTLTPEELSMVEYHIQSSRGELLFARCWLLTEGETDYWLFFAVAALMGKDLHALSIRIVNTRWSDAELLAKVANDFGIEWYLVADNDNQGNHDATKCRRHLQGNDESQRIHVLQHGSIEVFLCVAGYGHIYVRNISAQKHAGITAANGTIDYWKQVVKAQSDRVSKPELIRKVIAEMQMHGISSIPEDLKRIIMRVVALAENQA